MALVNCRECGKQISDQAAACPQCGFPMQAGIDPTPTRPSPPPATLSSALPGKKGQPLGGESTATKKTGCGTFLLAGLACLVVLLLLGKCLGPEKSNDPGTQGAASSSAVTPAPSISTDEKQGTSTKHSPAEFLANARDKSKPTAERLDQVRLLKETHPNSPESRQVEALESELKTLLNAERNPVGQQWVYATQEDDMSGKSVHTARVASTNTFSFDFPYAGRQRAELLIRRHPRWGNDVVLRIEKGQILCHSYSSCPVRIRFDDAPARTFSGTEPADNSSETVFIPGYDNFTRKLAAAKRMRVEFNVYQQGSVMAEFDVSGFDRKRLSN